MCHALEAPLAQRLALDDAGDGGGAAGGAAIQVRPYTPALYHTYKGLCDPESLSEIVLFVPSIKQSANDKHLFIRQL